MKLLLITIMTVVIILAGFTSYSVFADEESFARQAEQAGNYREALTNYVKALQSVSEGSSKDQELREKIIKLVQKIQPPPVVPEEALRYMARGQAAIESAKNKSDYKDAVAEFKKVANTAPWWADAYYNLGVAQEKTDQYSEAILSLKYYILAAPNASDMQSVQTKIFKLEYKMEKSAKTVNLDEEWTGTAEEPDLGKLAGTWKQGENSHYNIIVSGKEIIIVNSEVYVEGAGWQRQGASPVWRGTIEGSTIQGTYEYDYDLTNRGHGIFKVNRPITGTISADMKTIYITYTSPLPSSGGQPPSTWKDNTVNLVLNRD